MRRLFVLSLVALCMPARADLVRSYPQRLPNRSLNIWAIGDSHVQGSINTLTVAGTEVLGYWTLNSPRDRSWSGTADLGYFPINNGIGVTTGTQDPNVAATAKGSFTAWLPSVLRQGYPAFDVIRVANTGMGGACSYSWNGNQASAYFQSDGTNPSADETVTVAGSVYTFKASAAAAMEVTIGASSTATLVNLCNAVNAEGTGWGTGTTRHQTVYCPNAPAAQLIRLIAADTGTAGNSLTLAEASAHLSVYQQFAGGAAIPAGLYTANRALVQAAGFGTPDVVLIALGTNDAARVGWRGRGTQANMSALIAQIRSDYPLAKIIVWRPPVSGAGGLTASTLTGTVVPAIDAAIAAADPAYVSSVDVYSLGAGTAPFGIVSNDGVHLSSYGYSVAAQLFARAIISVMGLP